MNRLRPARTDSRLALGPLETERQVLAEGRWDNVNFFSATQDIHAGVVWTIYRDVDTVIVHLGGPISRLETELDGCGFAFGPPMAGEIWVVPAGQRYSTSAVGGRVQYAELCFDRRLLGAGSPAIVDHPTRALAGHFDYTLLQGARRLEELSSAADDLSRLAAESLSRTLLLDFYCRYSRAERPTSLARRIRLTGDERRRTEAFIEDHLDAPLRLEALAAFVHMTGHEYLIAFRAAFGVTPAQYIIEHRLRRARRLLLTSRKSIATIAAETGFSSQAHLATCFRSRLKMTPREFRRVQGAG